MKNRYYIFLVLITAFLSITSCKDYLNQVPTGILTLQKTFETRQSTLQSLASVYTYLPDENQQRWTCSGDASQGTSGAWVAGSDEAEYVWDFNGAQTINNGSLTSQTDFVENYWKKYYDGIRSATVFMDNLILCKQLAAGDYDQFYAEAKALRAIYYYYLLRLYGPVPIIKTPIKEQTSLSELQLPRNSVKEVVDYILSELDAAMKGGLIDNIKTSSNPTDQFRGLSHIDQAIAKAYKVETRMLAASDLFTGKNQYFSNLSNADGKKLFPQYSDAERKQLWTDAANETKEFIDKYVGKGYALTKQYTNGVFDPYLSYREAVRGYRSGITNFNTTPGTPISSAAEMIMFIEHTNCSTLQYDRTPKHIADGVPAGYKASSGEGATQEAVDAYFMANGIKPILGYMSDNKTPIINSASGYQDTGFSTQDYLDPVTGRVLAPKGVLNAWIGREPRFYADITFDGQQWLNTSGGIVYTGLQYDGNSGKNTGSKNDYSKTGYVVRKSAPLGDWGANDRICILLRLAQIYLDYAEALQESNPGNPDILKYLNLIRERAGIPQYGSGTGMLPVPTDMRQAIRDERRVELAFEGARYFDVRRWCTAEDSQAKPITGMNVDKNGNNFFVRTIVENRSFVPKNYFFPLPQKDIIIDKNLVQNPGW